jgi:hypothetical protein
MNSRSLANLRPPWKAGETPNPTGINKKRPFSDEMWQASAETMPEILIRKFNKKAGAPLLRVGDTWARGVAVRLCLEAAMQGLMKAVKEMADRIEGKPPQRLEIASGPTRKEVTLTVIFEKRARPGEGLGLER